RPRRDGGGTSDLEPIALSKSRAAARGRFITIEGGEGAGKSTQLDLLVTALTRAGIAADRTREPGGSERGEARRVLRLEGAPGRQALRRCRSLRAARSCLPRTLAARLPRDRRGRAEALCGHRCTGRSRKRASRRAGGRHRAARRRSQIMSRSQARETAPEPAAPPPRANPDLLGHEAAEAELRR